jgi:hypothetical protein
MARPIASRSLDAIAPVVGPYAPSAVTAREVSPVHIDELARQVAATVTMATRANIGRVISAAV